MAQVILVAQTSALTSEAIIACNTSLQEAQPQETPWEPVPLAVEGPLSSNETTWTLALSLMTRDAASLALLQISRNRRTMLFSSTVAVVCHPDQLWNVLGLPALKRALLTKA